MSTRSRSGCVEYLKECLCATEGDHQMRNRKWSMKLLRVLWCNFWEEHKRVKPKMAIETLASDQVGLLEYEQVYLDNLPSAETYEYSYMHRDVIAHITVTKSGFIITASIDGHVKFWRKLEEAGIEFVKHFRSHLGNIEDVAASSNGEYYCTISNDKSVKVFDVVNFDMINMLKLSFPPSCCCWLFTAGDVVAALAISLVDWVLSPSLSQQYNSQFDVVVSSDESGMVEYWTGPKRDYGFPKNISWSYKTDTDLYDFVKYKSVPTHMCFSPNGLLMAAVSTDRKVRIFKFLTGKLSKVFDESLERVTAVQQIKQQLPNMEFGRRMAVERDLEKSTSFRNCNIVFDETGYFVLYSSMLGVKVVNLYTNQCMRILGKPENARLLQIDLLQGSGKRHKVALDADMVAADNPIIQAPLQDPTLFCTAFKKNRFYMFTRREPEDIKRYDTNVDVYLLFLSVSFSIQDASYTRVAESCILHTSSGDIHCKLFPRECPKTVENFCVHSRNSYFNGHIFHRIIKGFMIQTGDPLGNGTGGESIWGGEFEDEFHPSLRHDRPYTLSMANAGANSNGSQFFITVVPTPWLDNKHTVFGRVTKGMEVVQTISTVKTNPKTDKPYDDIRIVSVTIK
ncbi:peptidylprolyl isomerase domain and WD repeat-containing protein 1 [Octopus bimaculoides]|nr:peptidylprolyl isomerase domain and WD repeat-containing protein 1 [Octopus bimaculoides]|eukprot:XP_014776144.1 PREDICTED: peptidylprolyl isomerase domain and WD repeat-containing protein 1-like [Octopus bimaculoides]